MGVAAAQGGFRSDLGGLGCRRGPVCRTPVTRSVKSARCARNRRRYGAQPFDLRRRRAGDLCRGGDRGRQPRRRSSSTSPGFGRVGTQLPRLLCHAAQRLPATQRSRDQRRETAARRARRHFLPKFRFARAACRQQQMSVAAKICGLTTEAAVTAAVAGGAAFLGFVFYPPSPRAVTALRAARLCAAVPAGIARVGLFVDADDDGIRAVLAKVPIDILQFDAKPPRRPDALPGGNGLAFDWGLIGGRTWRCRWMLSGGLTAELLPEAVAISGATAVDVSSGVESRPGEKDLDKIREFLAAARALG